MGDMSSIRKVVFYYFPQLELFRHLTDVRASPHRYAHHSLRQVNSNNKNAIIKNLNFHLTFDK